MFELNYRNEIKPKIKKWSAFKKIILGFVCLAGIGTGLFVWMVASLFVEPDLTKLPAYHPFKSAQAKVEYLNYYDSRAARWPVPSETKYIETSYGKTFVRICGPENAPRLVLMPSVGASSLMWIPNIKTLSAHFKVFAVDNVYDMGRSVYSRTMKKPEDAVAWMDELFTGLQLGNNINIAGLSFGGWLTCEYALHHPERLHKAVLIAPAATIIALPTDWAWRGILAAVPNRYGMYSMVNWACSELVKRQDAASRQFVKDIVMDTSMGLKCFKFKMPIAPTVFTDNELRSLKMPILFLVGKQEVIYPAQAAVDRFNKLVPKVKAEIIPSASHDVTYVQSELVDQSIIEFLK